jgi:hypothetical protein
MAKKHVVKERVALVSPKGSRVTVGVDLAARLRTKGYKAVGGEITPADPAEMPMTDAEKARTGEQEANADTGAKPPATAAEVPSRGASLAAWAGFADTVGFTYPEGATRDQIRDAYEAEHPAE